jgi:hypothetical protein
MSAVIVSGKRYTVPESLTLGESRATRGTLGI